METVAEGTLAFSKAAPAPAAADTPSGPAADGRTAAHDVAWEGTSNSVKPPSSYQPHAGERKARALAALDGLREEVRRAPMTR